MEELLKKELKKLKGEWIELSLHPEFGETTISKKPTNRAFINEGRLGKFENISEGVYDRMVNKYDSRYKK